MSVGRIQALKELLGKAEEHDRRLVAQLKEGYATMSDALDDLASAAHDFIIYANGRVDKALDGPERTRLVDAVDEAFGLLRR